MAWHLLNVPLRYEKYRYDDNKLFKHKKKSERVRKADHRNAVRVAVV